MAKLRPPKGKGEIRKATHKHITLKLEYTINIIRYNNLSIAPPKLWEKKNEERKTSNNSNICMTLFINKGKFISD